MYPLAKKERGQDISTMLIFSNSVYLQNSGYQFSQFRHRTRGYDSRYEEKYINGVSFNEQVKGVFLTPLSVHSTTLLTVLYQLPQYPLRW